MDAVKHTPGPWEVQEPGTLWEYEITPVFDGPPEVGNWAPVASVEGDYGEHGEGEANARLIAAAPDLKQAIAGLLDTFGGYNCPEVDAAITAMQKVGEDRWSMQSQMAANPTA